MTANGAQPAGLVGKGIIEREGRGRRGGGRGANRYRILPSNVFEEEQTRQGGGGSVSDSS